jgi:hypothetical protein
LGGTFKTQKEAWGFAGHSSSSRFVLGVVWVGAKLKNDRELPFKGFNKVREADQGWAWSEVKLV